MRDEASTTSSDPLPLERLSQEEAEDILEDLLKLLKKGK